MPINRNDSEQQAKTSFTGRGAFDCFQVGGRLIGTIIMDLSHPPFAPSDHPDFHFAPGYRFWPAGVVSPKDSNGESW